MNISPISFGSTYKIKLNNHDGWIISNKLEEFTDYVPEKDFSSAISYDKEGNLYKRIILNDKYDETLEVFLQNYGIKFTKTSTEELLSEKGIKQRMRIPRDINSGYLPNLVYVKTDKFDEIFSKNPFEQYLGNYETMSQPERYDGFIKYLKTNEPIDASIVYISEVNGKPQVDFQDGRHRYAVMRDMGFKTIPVVMTNESRITGEKFGLVE